MTTIEQLEAEQGGSRADPEGMPGPGGMSVQIVPWPDDVVEAHGLDPRSWYAEQFWLPVLGPTSLWLLRRAAAVFEQAPDGFTVELGELSRLLGLGGGIGRNSPMARTLGRCVNFDVARRSSGDIIEVRRALPPLPQRYRVRLPLRLQRLHDAWLHSSARLRDFEAEQARARAIALELLHPDVLAIQVMRRGVHPALADGAVAWAIGRCRDGSAAADHGALPCHAGVDPPKHAVHGAPVRLP
ncbi:MAG: hypothetical protein ACYDD4_09920 [Acidimicrobiales bacterium]